MEYVRYRNPRLTFEEIRSHFIFSSKKRYYAGIMKLPNETIIPDPSFVFEEEAFMGQG